MKRFRAGMWLILGAIMILGVSGVPSHAAVVVFSDNFDTENGGVGVLNYAGFTNWTVSDGFVDLIPLPGPIFDFYPGNGLYVDIDGSKSDAGIMTSTSLSLGAGNYDLRFFLGGNQRGFPTDTVAVSVEVGLASASFSLDSSDPLIEYSMPFTVLAGTSANIVFDHAGGDNIGIILDQVRLLRVPEPGTMALLGTGLFGMIMVGYRRKKRMV